MIVVRGVIVEHSEGEERGVARRNPVPALTQNPVRAVSSVSGKSRESPVRVQAPNPVVSVVQVKSRGEHWPVWVGSKQISHAVR